MDEVFGDAAMAMVVGDLNQLTSVLDASPDLVSQESSVGHPTLLQLVACEAHNLPDPAASAEVLIGRGAPLDGPLVAAAGCGSIAVLNTILDAGAPVGGVTEWTPLDEAIYWDQGDTIKVLLDRGATAHRLRITAGLGRADAIANWFDDTVLRADAGPVASPFAETVPEDRANDPTDIIDHAFVMAVNAGHRETGEALLERGARINAKPPGFHWQGAALHAACWRGNVELVDWLLSVGADPTLRDDMVDADAVGWAAYHEHHELAERLRSR